MGMVNSIEHATNDRGVAFIFLGRVRGSRSMGNLRVLRGAVGVGECGGHRNQRRLQFSCVVGTKG